MHSKQATAERRYVVERVVRADLLCCRRRCQINLSLDLSMVQAARLDQGIARTGLLHYPVVLARPLALVLVRPIEEYPSHWGLGSKNVVGGRVLVEILPVTDPIGGHEAQNMCVMNFNVVMVTATFPHIGLIKETSRGSATSVLERATAVGGRGMRARLSKGRVR